MNLINVAVARSVWLFPLEELNRGGLRLYPTLADAVTERYDFDELKPEEYKPESGLHLKNGVYHGSGNRDVLVGLQVYNDGIVAETISSTADSDAFVEDLLKWLASEFRMNYHPKLVRQRLHYSELVVTSDADLAGICDKLDKFSERLSSLKIFGVEQETRTTAIVFGADGKTQPSFSFERKTGVPFKDDRYYSRAALPTSEHESLLQEFEKLFSLQKS